MAKSKTKSSKSSKSSKSKKSVDNTDLDMEGQPVTAYNVKLKQHDVMNNIIPVKYETKTGNYRYRLSGQGSDGTNMSKFCNKEVAEHFADAKGVEIETAVAKTKKKKSCKEIGEDAEDRCETTRGKKKAAKKPAKSKGRGKKKAATPPSSSEEDSSSEDEESEKTSKPTETSAAEASSEASGSDDESSSEVGDSTSEEAPKKASKKAAKKKAAPKRKGRGKK